MFQPLPLYIGLRYTRAKRRNHFISFISFVSVFGIALGITVIITVLSVMNGFQTEVRDRILGMTSHAVVTDINGKLGDWSDLVARIGENAEVVDSAPFVEGQAMLIAGSRVSGALLRGVLPEEEPRVSTVDQEMVTGDITDLTEGDYHIALGRELANYLGVTEGDKVTVVTPQATVTPAGILPRLRRFTVTGIYAVGMSDYDRNTAMINIRDASKLFQLKGDVSGLRLKLNDLYAAPRIARQLNAELGGRYWVRDWSQQHANFFRAVQMEKTMMFIIMTLIVAVAAFNIVSTLVMVVQDKQADIAILRTLGITPNRIMMIFMIQGTVIGLAGTLLGVLGGIALALNLEVIVAGIEQILGMKFLSPDVYYISDLPSDLQVADVTLVGLVAFLLTVTATIYPAWRAARTQPAEALRYE